jgi:hypothetical protein
MGKDVYDVVMGRKARNTGPPIQHPAGAGQRGSPLSPPFDVVSLAHPQFDLHPRQRVQLRWPDRSRVALLRSKTLPSATASYSRYVSVAGALLDFERGDPRLLPPHHSNIVFDRLRGTFARLARCAMI